MSENTKPPRLTVFDRPNSPDGYAIRDYLTRGVVGFDCVDLTDDHDCRRELGFPTLDHVRLPVVRLADGVQLFGPTLRELAERLGWVQEARLNEYDLSIYGAGPA